MVSNPRKKLGPAGDNRGRDRPAEYQAPPMQELPGAALFRQMPVHLVNFRLHVSERGLYGRNALGMIGCLVKSRRHDAGPRMEN